MSDSVIDQMERMLAAGNDGQTTTKGRSEFPPAGVYRVIPDAIHLPKGNVQVINVTFDIDECMSNAKLDVQGRKLSAAFWCNKPEAIQRSADQLSYAVNGHPANAKMSMAEVAKYISDLNEAKSWIVDREIVPGRTEGVTFIRDRFYTPERWARKLDDASPVSSQINSDEPTPEELAKQVASA